MSQHDASFPADILALQRRLARWLLAGEDPGSALAALVEGPGLSVHRNNVRATLADALGEMHPVTLAVVGEAYFQQVAGQWLVLSPPPSGTLLTWGEGFAGFLDRRAAADGVPYLPDLARLEWRRHAALHGPEADVLRPEDLAHLPPESMESLCLTLHPTVGLLVSAWPVADLWQAHQTPDGLDQLRFAPRHQEIVIVRPGASVLIHSLPPGGAAFLAALDRGIGAAIEEASQQIGSPFDAGPLLATALLGGWFVRERFKGWPAREERK